MRARRVWLVLVLLLIPVAASAHRHNSDFCAAMSGAKGSALWGTQLTLAVTSARPTSYDLSLVGDLSVHVGEEAGTDLTRIATMLGTRWNLFASESDKHLVFGQFLAGWVHEHRGTPQRVSDPAAAYGVGYEFDPKGNDSGLAVRVQIEYVQVKDREDFPRASVGIVYRVARNR